MTIDMEKHHIDYNATLTSMLKNVYLSFLPYLFIYNIRPTEMEVGS